MYIRMREDEIGLARCFFVLGELRLGVRFPYVLWVLGFGVIEIEL